MTYLATITSKRQFTIPSELYKKVGFARGDKVTIEEKNEGLYIRSAVGLVKQLAGSVSIPQHLRTDDLDQAITMAKKNYFKTKK